MENFLTTPQKRLSVPDAETWKEFCQNARRIWRKAHEGTKKEVGRPSVNERMWEAMWNLSQAGTIRKGMSHNKIYQAVEEYLGDTAPAESTIRNHALAWLILEKLHKMKPRPTIEELKILKKYVPARFNLKVRWWELWLYGVPLMEDNPNRETLKREQSMLNRIEKEITLFSPILPAEKRTSLKKKLKLAKVRLAPVQSSGKSKASASKQVSPQKSRSR